MILRFNKSILVKVKHNIIKPVTLIIYPLKPVPEMSATKCSSQTKVAKNIGDGGMRKKRIFNA